MALSCGSFFSIRLNERGNRWGGGGVSCDEVFLKCSGALTQANVDIYLIIMSSYMSSHIYSHEQLRTSTFTQNTRTPSCTHAHRHSP